jgi:hypothetical protein
MSIDGPGSGWEEPSVRGAMGDVDSDVGDVEEDEGGGVLDWTCED